MVELLAATSFGDLQDNFTNVATEDESKDQRALKAAGKNESTES
jgi:hypothetical protein